MKNSNTEQQILANYRQTGDMTYVGRLFKTHYHLVLGLALHYLKDKALAEDAVMDIFESLLEKLKSHQVDSFRPWVLQVTRNHCLKKIKRCLSKNKSEELKEKHFNIMENAPDWDPDYEALLNKVEASIESLSPQQQKCISLFYYKDMSYAEVSEQTGYSLKEVKSYLQNGKEKMKRKIGATF